MDREGFRNRLKQYKEAKGFDPLLKYWDWKLKYDSTPQPDSMPGQPQPDLPTVISQPLDDRAHRWDNGYVQINRQPLDSPYEDARYYDYRKPRFEFRKGDVHYSNPNLLKFIGRFGKVIRGGSLLGEIILNLFPSEEAELIEDLRVKMDKQNKWLTGQEDIPKYDEGTHKVAAGESLSSIAKRYKLDLQDLIDYNPQIKNPNIIGIGQEINIKDKALQSTTGWVDYRELRLKERDIADSTTTVNYSIKSGDSLSKIAKDNGLTLKQLLMQNPQITDPNKISIGQNLSITTTKDGNMAAILSVSHRGNYVVIDKVNKKLTVYNKDNKPIYVTDNIATGASGDDYNTITYVDANGVIRNMQGNNSTPAGITEITGKGVYHGAKSFTRGRYNRLTGNFDDNIASSLHTGRIDIGSNGCVRLPKKELDDLNNLVRRGTKVYTLPEQEGSRFVKKDNKLSFVADNPYGTNTGKTKYWDDYNTYVDTTYNPLSISYAGDYNGLSDEYINNSTAFANALSSNKQALLRELGLDSATYNDLAELALGIAQQESNFGTSTRKKIKDAMPNELLDLIKKATRGKSSARSVGMTQIKMDADNDQMQQFYKKYNITPDNILDSAELSAIATIGRLAHMYNNEVRGRTFTGENGINIDPIDATLYKYMGKNNELVKKTATPEKNIYIQNVKRYAKDWDLLSQTESFAEGGEVEPNLLNYFKQ